MCTYSIRFDYILCRINMWWPSSLFGVLVISFVVLLLIYLGQKTYVFWTTLRLIPTPQGAPILGNLLLFISDADKTNLFYKARNFASKYYPIYRLSALYVTAVSLLDPNDVELVLSSSKHLSKTYAYNFLKEWLGTGLLTSKGKKWHQRRKILTPAFHFNILQQFVGVFNDETDKLVKKLAEECGKPSFNVIPQITNFTLQSIEETAMGFKNFDESSHAEYKDAIYKMGKLVLRRIGKPWMHLRSLYKFTSMWQEEKGLIAILHNFTNNIITEREKQNVPTLPTSKKRRLAMLDLLLAAKSEGANIDHEGIREEVDTFMFEGHDTTSMAISFLLLTLANLNDIQIKVREEILKVVGPSKQPTFSDLQDLKYTERCIKETLRLFPSVPFITRFAAETFKTTTGYTIPKGTILHIHIYDIHRNPEVYPEPLKFNPDRFLPENVNERHPFAYIPFSAGPRNCIGQRYALLELKAALCGILRTFELEPVDGMHDIIFRPDLVLRPATEVRIKIVSRS